MRFLRNSALCLLALALLFWLARAPGDPALFPAPAGADVTTVHVVDFGWHTGLILRTADLRRAGLAMQDADPDRAIVLLDLARQMGHGEWVEIGWGDQAFYRANVVGLTDLPVMTGLNAVVGSPDTLLHIFPGIGDPADAFPASDLIVLDLSGEGFNRLALALAASFDRAPDGTLRDIGQGIYGAARFYAARGRYSALRTCNNWVSGLLRAAGVPSSGVFSTFSAGLMAELRHRAD